MKPQDLDDHAPVEPDDELLASVHSRSRSFRRRRTTQRLTSATAGLLVLALAGGIAWTRVDATNDRGISPAATSTTTQPSAPALTQNAILGKWRPVSIDGYFFGPRTKAYISFDGRGSWSMSDTCNETKDASYRIEGTEVRLRRGGIQSRPGCVPTNGYPDFGVLISATRIELREANLIFLAADGTEIALFARAGATARIELPSTTMTAGSTMSAHVVIENNTGQAIHAGGCGSLFAVMLGNDAIHPDPAWPLCGQDIVIPVGETSYPVDIWATYSACAPASTNGTPRCLPGGQMPPLPAGDYQARFFQSSPAVTPALPIDVTVTAR